MKKRFILSFLASIFITFPAYADKKIAVLPFNIPEKTEDIKQFSFGTMASINHALSKIPEYTLIDRGQINAILKEIGFQNSGFTDQNTVKIGKLSGIDILVFGNIQKSNDKYRIDLSFTEIETGKILKTFQVTGTDIFDLEDKIASEILKNTSVNSRDVIETNSSTAYNAYISGKELINFFDINDNNKAIEFFNNAISNDKNYIPAIAAKARANATQALIMKYKKQDYESKIIESIKDSQQALLADPESVDAYLALYIIESIKDGTNNLAKLTEKLIRFNQSEYTNFNYKLGYFYTPKDKAKAEYFLKEALRVDPNYIFAYSGLVHLYTLENKIVQALEFANKGTSIKSDFIPLKANKAFMYSVKGDLDSAIKEYYEILDLKSDFTSDSTIYNAISSLLIGKGNYPEAEKMLKKGIELEPKSSSGYSILGQLYIKTNRLDEALASFNTSQKLSENQEGNPGFMDAYNFYYMAQVYEKKNELSSAIDKIKQAIKINGNSSLFNDYLISLYEKNKMYDLAINELDNQIKLKPDNFNNYIRLADTYFTLGQYDSAINNLKLALSKSSDETKKSEINEKLRESYINSAIASYNAKNYNTAILLYTSALQLKPDVSVYNNLGVAYYMLGKNDLAIEQYKKAIELNSNHIDSHNNLGIAYDVSGKKDDAVNEYKKACELGYKERCK